MNKTKNTKTIYALRSKIYEKGQILLILVMILAIITTVVLTISFTSRTDTQLTKLEEETQKALAAAEAGVEATLQRNARIDNLESFEGLGSTISSGRTTLTTSSDRVFESPTIQSGEAYTAYLGTYTPGSPPIIGASNGQSVVICFGDAGSNPSLDIALVKDTAANILRYSVSSGAIANATAPTEIPSGGTCPGTTVTGYRYSFQINEADISTNSKFLVIRSLFSNTKLLITQDGLPAQGQTVNSQATTKTGVTKVVELFQSYPQIPAEFFSTAF